MQGGLDNPAGEDVPSSSDDATPTADVRPHAEQAPPQHRSGASAAGQPDLAARVTTAPPPPPVPATPSLPQNDAKKPPVMIATAATPTRGAETWYRTDQDRFKSVQRRANPWYRRLARGIIGLAFVAAAGIGLFYGAQVVQDFLDRDALPNIGADVPEIRATSFEIRSTAPAPVLDGTLTLDAETRAFEYIGRGTGAQAGIQVVSPDGSTVFVRRGSDAWQAAGAADQIANDARRAASYLADADSADHILTVQLRRGYVDLIDRVEIGEGDDALRRYEMRLDTAAFDDELPLQYRAFEDRAIPGVDAVRGLLVTITLDNEDVVVAVVDTGTNWSWQRLTYSDQPFRPIDPADDPLGSTIEVTDGTADG